MPPAWCRPGAGIIRPLVPPSRRRWSGISRFIRRISCWDNWPRTGATQSPRCRNSSRPSPVGARTRSRTMSMARPCCAQDVLPTQRLSFRRRRGSSRIMLIPTSGSGKRASRRTIPRRPFRRSRVTPRARPPAPRTSALHDSASPRSDTPKRSSSQMIRHGWALAVLAATRGCASSGATPTRTTSDHESVAREATGILSRLTTRQKIAQLVVPWLNGTYAALDDSTFQIAKRWVDTLEVGGIIISAGGPYDIAAKLNALQQRSKLPLLISADLEWGAAMRVVGATAFPHIMAAGATGDERDAYVIGRGAALEGRAVGIHVNFAPDADINNNPLNPVINIRSFSEDPKAVAKLVGAYVRGLQDNGMLATLKHFPGHGDTDVDSHIGLPAIRADYPRLDSVELVPFRAGIDAGAKVVMSAHIAFPAFTGDAPATLSASVLTGILRDSLKFGGLVVTDALQMGAIVSKYGAGEAAVRAFEAGSDLLLMPADPDSAIASMLAALQSGRITAARLDASVRRMLEIKQGLGLFRRRTVPLDSIAKTVGSKAFLDAADAIAHRSMTLVRDTAGTIVRLRRTQSRMAIIAYGDELNSFAGQRMLELLRAGGDTVGFFRLWPMS